MKKMAESSEPFDVWFGEQVQQIHNMDIKQVLAGPAPESMLDWRA